MTLKEHIEDISNQLKQGAFTKEAEVSFGIVLKLLDTLGWPRFTLQVIVPEYGVEGQRVDFALCHPPGKPRVFIEVKQVGNLDGAEEQLFGYAFREGVPIAILTDGQKWQFFHSTGEGRYRDRKVYELDLIESDSEESVQRLNRYLNYEAVQTGDAVTAIKNDYQRVVKQREIEARLPELWSELLQEKNEYLLLAMMDKAKEKVGHEPTEEQVLTFLKSLERKTESNRREDSRSNFRDGNQRRSSTHRNEKQRKPTTNLVVTMPDGEVIDHYNASDTFLEVIEKLGFDEVMRVAPTVVSTQEFPFPSKKTVSRGKYFIYTSISTDQKKRYLERIGRDLRVQLKIEIVGK